MDLRTDGQPHRDGKHASWHFQRFLQRLEKQLAKMSRQQLAATQQAAAAHAAKWQCLDLIARRAWHQSAAILTNPRHLNGHFNKFG